MGYAVRKVQDVVVIELEGKVWGDWSTLRLKDDVKNLIAQRERKFLVDLSRVGLVNSVGIGVLVATLGSVMNAHGAFKLCGASERTRRAFGISGVTEAFDTHQTCEDALLTLGVGRPGGI